MNQHTVVSDAMQKVQNKDEILTINRIATRAAKELGADLISTDLDVTVTHARMPLKLEELLAAEPFDFAHDIAGIARHLNRDTGELEDCFVPRYAAPEQATA